MCVKCELYPFNVCDDLMIGAHNQRFFSAWVSKHETIFASKHPDDISKGLKKPTTLDKNEVKR